MRRKHALYLTVVGVAVLWSIVPRTNADSLPPGAPVPPVGSEGGPSRVLDAVETATWLRGRATFDRDFSLANGLGLPDINGDSCRACHQDPVIGGAGGLDVNVFRFAADAGGSGPFTNLPGGQVASKVRRPDTPLRDEFDPAADVFEQRQTPTLFGGGLLDSIPDSVILAGEDPLDADGNGIFGVARRISVGASGSTEIGRFGWKAQIPRLSDFIKDAMGGELGITTINDGRGFAFVTDDDSVADPELSSQDFDDMLFFMTNLAAPPRGQSQDPGVVVGENLFILVGCGRCHVPSLPGADGPVNAFTNLLLHDVMPAGFRGMEESGAPVGFYRTPPLWGISRSAPYMHDGRAESLFDAIQAHAGEATAVTAAFNALTTGAKNAVLLFLEDL